MKFLHLLPILVLACSSATEKNADTITELSPKEFQSRISPDVVLVDVRTPEEVAGGKLAGAINIDFKNESFQKRILTLDKSSTLMVYCASGVRSGKAAEWMKAEGFENVFTLKGGMRAWTTQGLGVVTE